jgi:hypothetical protein
MQTLTFDVLEWSEYAQNRATMRTYRNVHLSCLSIETSNLEDIEISVLSNAETLDIFHCEFNDFLEFKNILDSCHYARNLKLDHIKFEVLDDIPKNTNFSQRNENIPIKCSIESTSWKALNCISGISQLKIRGQYRECRSAKNYLEDLHMLLVNFAPVITDLFIDWPTEEVLQLLTSNETLQLASLSLSDVHPNIPMLRNFLRKQQSRIISFKLFSTLDRDVFDIIRQYLHNLKILKCVLVNDLPVKLNDLRVLKKLENLYIWLAHSATETPFHLNVGELPLTVLTIAAPVYHHSFELTSFNNSTQMHMRSMKKLEIFNVRMAQDVFFQMIKIMPNLEHLSFKFRVSFQIFFY